MAVRKSKKGAALKKWFKEEWVDVKTGKPCGRKSAKKGKSKRPYPSCRPKAVAAKMTDDSVSKLKKLLLLAVRLAPKQSNTQSQLQVRTKKVYKKSLTTNIKVCYNKTIVNNIRGNYDS